MGNATHVDHNGICTRFTVVNVVPTEEVSKSKGLARKAAVIVSVKHGNHFPIVGSK
jgi:hypothetical protein